MQLRTVYLLLSVAGTVAPYSQFVPWLREFGFSWRFFGQQLFANRITAFFGRDVLVSAVVLIVFMRTESARSGVRSRWLPIVGLLTVGVSLALPLFLYLRELAPDSSEKYSTRRSKD